MVKTLTKLGNSKALIIPAELIKKYGLDEVILEEKPEGILIRSAVKRTGFQKSVDELRQYKTEIYSRIELQANEPETIEYYKKSANDLSDIDLDIIEE
ncbi:MAG: AbrB/MazE/SpoVT family DNA-binding domain-containing protein [Algoriphagus sp.]|uniref:AbrB/MazE/SpoVT family DNA-binding domain-containing protein n=1 Tax=Algoriphagus sp. TaxID=1872435 RepID=UPI00273124D7|nr:AbrB/MazE/SpoVT family DNA-binding domain-containing protein [Algoriphagus sp.]MDP2040350.1 AbrB/MazE/SpoVT family DNA-binding domain-containing protein [Algoriphagus sp.]MDP3473847.1 AbrB/MazE/SpoVT family DNA-binding domain-containing protein [Algoriphagus sp.]